MVEILFFGNKTNYSDQVKTTLEQAGYEFGSDGLVVSAAYGQKLPPGGLNLHPSLLPAYRGATPVPQQILDGVKESGITIIKMINKIDAGPIIAQEKIPVLPDDTSEDLLNRAFKAGAKLLIKILPDYLAGKITLKPQPEKSPTPYCRRLTKNDGFISFSQFKSYLTRSDLVIERRIRAFYPWPGVWTRLPASTRKDSSTRGGPNNKILKLLPNNMLQLESKSPITRKQFMSGYGNLFS